MGRQAMLLHLGEKPDYSTWSITMNLLGQLDDFWREGLQSSGSDWSFLQTKYADFVQRVGDQVAHLPDEEQNRIVKQVVDRNTEYIAMAKQDRNALKVRLGLPAFAGSAVEQLDDFWRDALQSGGYDNQRKYADLMKRLQDQVSHLPQAEQDKFFMPFVTRNAEYIAIAKRDKNALKIRLGVPVSSPSAVNTGRLAQVAADTVVRATIWESIAGLFRAFR
jgi:hypothetical protein